MSEGKRVDEDWKRRAQAEKELDAAKVNPAPAPSPAPAAAPALPGVPGQEYSSRQQGRPRSFQPPGPQTPGGGR